jgi:hypothetical protein
MLQSDSGNACDMWCSWRVTTRQGDRRRNDCRCSPQRCQAGRPYQKRSGNDDHGGFQQDSCCGSCPKPRVEPGRDPRIICCQRINDPPSGDGDRARARHAVLHVFWARQHPLIPSLLANLERGPGWIYNCGKLLTSVILPMHRRRCGMNVRSIFGIAGSSDFSDPAHAST